MSKESWFWQYERDYDNRLAEAEEMRYILQLERAKAAEKKKESEPSE